LKINAGGIKGIKEVYPKNTHFKVSVHFFVKLQGNIKNKMICLIRTE